MLKYLVTDNKIRLAQTVMNDRSPTAHIETNNPRPVRSIRYNGAANDFVLLALGRISPFPAIILRQTGLSRSQGVITGQTGGDMSISDLPLDGARVRSSKGVSSRLTGSTTGSLPSRCLCGSTSTLRGSIDPINNGGNLSALFRDSVMNLLYTLLKDLFSDRKKR